MEVQEVIAMLLTPVSQVALIMALAQLIKEIGFPAKFIPVVDLVLGIISGILVYGLMLGYGIGQGLLLGIALGLSACGLFAGIKNIKEGTE